MKEPTRYVDCVSHLDKIVPAETRKKIVKSCVTAIQQAEKDGLKFNAIAVSGVSGITLGSILAHLLDKNLIVVRTTKGDHSENMVEGCCDDSYIIVDDLICTGKTVQRIIRNIYEKLCGHSKCVGMLMWNNEKYEARWNTQYLHTLIKEALSEPIQS